MTERRPHWDDDLLDSVQREMHRTLPADQPVLRLYNIIASVEDWQDKQIMNRDRYDR